MWNLKGTSSGVLETVHCDVSYATVVMNVLLFRMYTFFSSVKNAPFVPCNEN